MTELPAGTVTLLFTDIEGSTRLLQALGEAYGSLLADHHRLLREAFGARSGVEVGTAGDSLYFTFPTARAAILAAIDGQRAVLGHPWPLDASVRVRMGMHTGEPTSGEAGYVGLDVHRAARISAAGHGGQILVSRTTRDLVADDLPPEVDLLDLGEHRLKDLATSHRLFQVLAPGLPREFSALRSLDARPNNLPRQLTSFVGREQELADGKAMLIAGPLVTLTGPGGVGKTRLALELAAEVLDSFDDGAWVVFLASLTDPAFVLQEVATTMGAVEQPGRALIDTVLDHVRSRRLLLVLDNCEHVVRACAETADALLRAAPGLRIVATSREGLGISGEGLFPVPSLSVPDPGGVTSGDVLARSDAVRLFTERAMAALPSFRVSDQNARPVAQICQRLDGIPLALELAAARVRSLPVEQIAARLDDRFRLLTGSSRLTVPRHQTLRATMDWSYELLSEDERAILRRVAVFAGRCSLEAAEAVCAGRLVAGTDVLDGLSRLVDKSLVVAEAFEGEARFRLLETVRQYGRDQLLESGEAADTQRRHRDWFLELAEEAAPEFFRGPESASWLARLDREHDNLRAALQWSEDEPGEQRAGLRLAAALWRFWEIRGYLVEGRGWLDRMLAATAEEVSTLRANALTGAGILAVMQGDYRAGYELHADSLELHRQLGDPNAISFAMNNLANAAVQLGDYQGASELHEGGAALAREAGDLRGMALGMVNLADDLAHLGDAAGARSRFDEAVGVFGEHGDRWGMAFAYDSFAVVACQQGDFEAARSMLARAREMFSGLGDDRGVARAMTHLGDVALQEGDLVRARSLYLESLAIRQSVGDMSGIAAAIEKIAWVHINDVPQIAACLVGCAEALRETMRAPVPADARPEYERHLTDLGSRLGADDFAAARIQGRTLAPDEAVARLPL